MLMMLNYELSCYEKQGDNLEDPPSPRYFKKNKEIKKSPYLKCN